MIIGTNFKLSSAKFLDDRQLCKDYATLIANAEGIIYPPGFEVFCEYENKYYQYVSDTNGGYIWEERKSGVSDGTIGASIKDDTISEDYTWSSAHIDSMRMDLENLITQVNDYVDEIDERMLFIEGKFQWFEYFDGSYESLTDKPTIPTKVSELENDSKFIDLERLELERADIDEKLNQKIDAEEDRTLIPVTELERLSTLGNYNDTEIRQLIDELEIQSHTHINSDILNTITEEKINQWDNNTGVDDYNYIQNKPIIRVGDDSDILLNFGQIIDEGMYIITAMVGEYKIHNELVHVKWTDDDNVTLTIPNMFMVLNANRTDGVWTIVNELYYGIDRENGKISDTLTIGEDKIILDKEGNGWFGGKVSQEGMPTEEKDLVTKGYVDERFTNYATNERIDVIDKENARRDVIIEALVNGRKRTIETDGNDVDLMFSTEKDKVWIDKIEGETLVNVCDQEEPIAITKSYTVEGTNHVPLQGEYDGKARPVVHGNTLVNHNIEYDKSIIIGERIDSIQGTEILNFEGTPNCEIKVDIDGHTAINLSTKKEDILCKSFDSTSGNEINLVAEENSRTDVILEGNTMVNLVCHDANKKSEQNFSGFYYQDLQLSRTSKFKLNTEYTIVLKVNFFDDHDEVFNRFQIGVGSELYGAMVSHPISTITYNNVTSENSIHYDMTKNSQTILAKIVFTDFRGYEYLKMRPFRCDSTLDPIGYKCHGYYEIMLFEGDLTQTPELIPTEYIEGIQSTFEDKLIPYSIYDGSQLTALTETQYQLPLSVKANTQYTIVTTANTTKYQYAVYSSDNLNEYFSYNDTVSSATFTSGVDNILFKVRMNPSYGGEDYSFVLSEVQDKFMIVEGDWSGRLDLLTDEYFGKYRVDMNSHGKNLFDGEWSLGYLGDSTGQLIQSNNYLGISSTNFISCNNIQYTFSYSSYTSCIFQLYCYDEYKNYLGFIYPEDTVRKKEYTDTLVIPYKNTKFIKFRLYSGTDNAFSSIGEGVTLQLEEGTQATQYEPYYGSSKTVYLNSPLLDGDELLTKDGKLYHYHKMGQVVLNGSEDEGIIGYSTVDNTARAYASVVKNCKSSSILGQQGFCDTLQFIAHHMDINNEYVNSYTLDKPHVYGSSDGIYVFIEISKLSTTDLTGVKQWLSENPTTVVYELAEPWYEPIGAYGKIVLDGSENWGKNASGNLFVYINSDVIKGVSTPAHLVPNIKCDKLNTIAFQDGYYGDISTGITFGDTKADRICIRNSNYTTIDEFKQWLQQNPVTVIYELANPQYIDEDTRFNIASTSTIEYQSSVPMANTQFLPYRNELPLLESSTQYRVTFDCDVEGLELMVSLGGTSQTITSALHNELSFITPSLQTDGKLTIDGYGIAKIDNVLITKGDMEYKYFEGLKSGFESGYIPVDITKDFENLIVNNGTNHVVDVPISNIKPNTKYTLYAPALEGNYIALRFRIPNGGELSTAVDSNISFTNPMIIETYDDTYDFSNVILRYYCEFTKGTSFSTKDIKIFEGDWSYLVEYLNELSEEDWNNSETYKATIKIKNPNAPIFGKGGRL